ncbi:hypothetical protein K9M50_01085 [Patescibacteria group bacterium]|nr:hypothetical protein [Patescibacteria group bacterium]
MKNKNNEKLKQFKPFLWSYDLDNLDVKRDKRRIITNVLNLGTKEACDSLFNIYTKEDIKKEIANPLPGEWNDKSLNYWSIIFNIKVKKTKNVLRNIR